MMLGLQPGLDLSDPLLQVLDGHKAEVEFRTELGHISVKIDLAEAANNGLLLADTDHPKLFG